MLGVPMIVGGEVIGILFLDNEDAAHPFDSEQQSLAASFAHLAGIAIMHGQRSSELRANLVTIARQNEICDRAARSRNVSRGLRSKAPRSPTSRTPCRT